jgi:hypothetical protein
VGKRPRRPLNSARRRFGLGLAAAVSGLAARGAGAADNAQAMTADRLVLSRFDADGGYLAPGVGWRGFSDRVMGGVSDAQFGRDVIGGRRCIRLTGTVTRDFGGGFVQMALYLGGRNRPFDASAWRGVELEVFGNDEDYNVHVRTSDCGWYDDSYRNTFRAPPRWMTVRIAWRDFVPNSVRVPLDPARLERIALLGWMREFEADIALASLSLYR